MRCPNAKGLSLLPHCIINLLGTRAMGQTRPGLTRAVLGGRQHRQCNSTAYKFPRTDPEGVDCAR